jgi:hypothetical protein
MEISRCRVVRGRKRGEGNDELGEIGLAPRLMIRVWMLGRLAAGTGRGRGSSSLSKVLACAILGGLARWMRVKVRVAMDQCRREPDPRSSL